MTFTDPSLKFGERSASIEIPQGTKLSDITEEKTITEAKGYVGRFLSEHCTGSCLANYTNQTYNLIVSASYTISVDGNVIESRNLNLPADGSGSIKTSFIYNNIKYVFMF